MGKASVSSVLTVLLNVAWYFVALVLALTTCLAAVTSFHEFRNVEMDIPVSFSVDARVLPVSAPSLAVEGAQIENVRGSLKFPPPTGSLVAPALLVLVATLVLVLFALGQLHAVFRTLRDGQPFVPANAIRIRRIGFVVIAGESARAAIVFAANAYAMNHFSATGLQFDARPDFNVFTIVHGLIILALAEVFRVGTRLHEDQSLTI